MVISAEGNVEGSENHRYPRERLAPPLPNVKGDQGEKKTGHEKKVDNKHPVQGEPIIGERAQDHGPVRGDEVEKGMSEKFHGPYQKERPESSHP